MGVPPVWDFYLRVSPKGAVSVAAGAAVRAEDLALVRARAARVTITVRDQNGRVAPSTVVRYAWTPRRAGSATIAFQGGGGIPDAAGAVQIGPLQPGTIAIQARALEASPAQVGAIRVALDGEPRDDLSLTLSPAATISGRVEFEGRATPLNGPDGLRVVDGVDGQTFGVIATSRRGVVDADGTFILDGLFDGACLTLWGIPDGWHLDSIDLLGRNYLNRPIPLASGQTVTGVVLRVVPDLGGSGDRSGRCAAPPAGAP